MARPTSSSTFDLESASLVRSVVGLLTVIAVACLVLAAAAAAGDGFRGAKGQDRTAIVRIANHKGLEGRFAVLVMRAGGTRFGVACGTGGGTYHGLVPVRVRAGRWRAYDAGSGGLQTYQAACEQRR